MRARRRGRTKTREPRNHQGTQRTGRNTVPIAAVPGRSAALELCVASSIAAARRDAAQAAFDRKTSHNKRAIPVLRAQGIVYRPLVRQQMVSHTQQSPEPYSAQQTRRCATMKRAVFPNISPREQWLLAGLIDRPEHPARRKRRRRHRQKNGHHEPRRRQRRHRFLHQPANHSDPFSKPVTVPHAPLRGALTLRKGQLALEVEDLVDDKSLSSFTVANSLNLERQVHTQRAFLQTPPTAPQLVHRQRSCPCTCSQGDNRAPAPHL